MSNTNSTNKVLIGLDPGYDALGTLVTTTTALYPLLRLKEPLPKPYFTDEGDPAKMIDAIKLRISEGKKPAASLIKHLDRIRIHTEHLTAAYVELFDIYTTMTTVPKTTVERIKDAEYKAKESSARVMLTMMPNKMLRDFAGMQGVDTAEYILPDDCGALINATIGKMLTTTPSETSETSE